MDLHVANSLVLMYPCTPLYPFKLRAFVTPLHGKQCNSLGVASCQVCTWLSGPPGLGLRLPPRLAVHHQLSIYWQTMAPQAELSLFVREMIQLLLSEVWWLTHAIVLSWSGEAQCRGVCTGKRMCCYGSSWAASLGRVACCWPGDFIRKAES